MFVWLLGLPVPVVWTRLAHTANAGDWTVIVQEAVTWKAGEHIVIASTGHRYLVMLIYLRYTLFFSFYPRKRGTTWNSPKLFYSDLSHLVKNHKQPNTCGSDVSLREITTVLRF